MEGALTTFSGRLFHVSNTLLLKAFSLTYMCVLPKLVIKKHLFGLCTGHSFTRNLYTVNIASEYDQEIPQSQTADNPVAP